MNFEQEFQLNIEASVPIIQIIGHETLRIRALCQKSCEKLSRRFFCWSRSTGLREKKNGTWNDTDEFQPHEVLEWSLDEERSEEEGFILLLEDFHPNLEPSEYMQIARLRRFAVEVASRHIQEATLVLSQPVRLLPPELEKETQVMEMPLPDIDVLRIILKQVQQRYRLDERDFHDSPRLLKAALGLSTSESQVAFSRAAVEFRRLTEREIPFIIKEKEQIIRKGGHLEYFHPTSGFSDIGGLDQLKSWLSRRAESFTEIAKQYGLENPRGVLLLGLPGTGKSLAAKSIANAWQLPLLRLDMGKVFGGIVGQSEGNMRSALKMAETLAPSILWVDEIEKGLSGMESSGSTDGGTTARVLGSFLTWMQEKKSSVFVVATANSIRSLPPELLRKGRMDEIFFVDLPVQADRIEIYKIHLEKRQREDLFLDTEIAKLARLSQGFTGAEIEEVIKEAMFLSFDKDEEDLSMASLEEAIEGTSPLSCTMHEEIGTIRRWVKGRAVPASSSDPEPISKPKSKRVRVRQEKNIFLDEIE